MLFSTLPMFFDTTPTNHFTQFLQPKSRPNKLNGENGEGGRDDSDRGGGVIIGPFGLKFFCDPDNMLHFAKLGVVFLLTHSTLFKPSANEILNY